MTQISIPISGKVIATIDGELTTQKKCEAVLAAEMEANASGKARLHLSMVVESELADRILELLIKSKGCEVINADRRTAEYIAKGLLA